MQGKYAFEGTYTEGTAQAAIHGTLEIDAEGAISGVLIDRSSPSPDRRVAGIFTQRNGTSCLDFVCEVKGEDFLNVLYRFGRKSNSSPEGTYSGSWRPVRKHLGFEVKGSFETGSGDTVYFGHNLELVPRQEDDRTQPAELILKRVV